MDNPMGPTVSILVPTYNRSAFLSETIWSLLNQEFLLEVIVIDDASTDDTVELVLSIAKENPNLVLVTREVNGGESAAINTGWREANGRYIGIVSSDDPQPKSWLKEMMIYINSNPNEGFYYPNVNLIDRDGVIIGRIETLEWSQKLIYSKMICVASAGTIIDTWKLPEGFVPRDESVVYPSDLLQFLELSKITTGKKVPSATSNFRNHSSSLTFGVNQIERSLAFHQNTSVWMAKNPDCFQDLRVKIASQTNLLLQSLAMIKFQFGPGRALQKALSNKYFRIQILNPYFSLGLIFYGIRRISRKIKSKFLSFPRKIKNYLKRKDITFFQYFSLNKQGRAIGNSVHDTLLLANPTSANLLDTSKSVEEFWESSHEIDSELWLTGTDPDWLFDYYGLESLIKDSNKKLKILNVGVGRGGCTKELAKNGHIVSALDISSAALEKVAGFVQQTYLANDIKTLPTSEFDLIIHHLVAQHMSIVDLELQVETLISSLSQNGMLCMQIASYQKNDRNDLGDGKMECMMGAVGRSEEAIKTLFDRPSLTVLEITQTNTYEEYGSSWYRIRAIKK
jgi:glycosyltransferase involved in cell wall biosynthesis